jgi:hypothetical protein
MQSSAVKGNNDFELITWLVIKTMTDANQAPIRECIPFHLPATSLRHRCAVCSPAWVTSQTGLLQYPLRGGFLFPVRPQTAISRTPRFVQRSGWKAIELLFQLTDEELSRNATLFKDTAVRHPCFSPTFFAVELQEGDYARGKLAAITRQINRIFPMPVMVLFKVAGNRLSIRRHQPQAEQAR